VQVRGDGRPYVASLRTDNWAKSEVDPPDLWQAFLFAPAGQWHTVQIPLTRFLLTHKGRVRAPCICPRAQPLPPHPHTYRPISFERCAEVLIEEDPFSTRRRHTQGLDPTQLSVTRKQQAWWTRRASCTRASSFCRVPHLVSTMELASASGTAHRLEQSVGLAGGGRVGVLHLRNSGEIDLQGRGPLVRGQPTTYVTTPSPESISRADQHGLPR
jgi:hypothetical protein